MHVLFLDEFGHPEAFNPNATSGSFNPVFGYGGFVLPAGNLAAFATHFFDIKTRQMRNKMMRELNQRETLSVDDLQLLDHLKGLQSDDAIQHDTQLRLRSAKDEVKGYEVFSRRYVAKLHENKKGNSNAKKKLRRFFNFARFFIKAIENHGGQIVFFGAEKACFAQSDFRNPHLKFIKDVLQGATRIAGTHNSTVGIFFDHHQVDEPSGASSDAKVGPRQQRARDIILAQHLYNWITEPASSYRSNESQCVQAADWICHLLAQTLPYQCDPKKWAKYRYFHEEIGELLFDNVSEVTSFRSRRPSADIRQRTLPFNFHSDREAGSRRRPYHKPH